MHLRSPLLTLQICGDMPCLNMRVHEFELPHPLMEITPQIYFTFLIFLKSEIKAAPSCFNFIIPKRENFVMCDVEPNLLWRYLTKNAMIQDKGILLEHGTMLQIHHKSFYNIVYLS